MLKTGPDLAKSLPCGRKASPSPFEHYFVHGDPPPPRGQAVLNKEVPLLPSRRSPQLINSGERKAGPIKTAVLKLGPTDVGLQLLEAFATTASGEGFRELLVQEHLGVALETAGLRG